MHKPESENPAANLPGWLQSHTTLICLLSIWVVLLYANTLQSPFALDDYHNILANKPIRITQISLTSIKEVIQDSLIENRPVANLSLALNYFFHQYDVTGYHLFNIGAHIITGILLYIFVLRTLQLLQNDFKTDAIKWIAFITALLWLVHPLQTQSVTYIIQRMNSLAAMYYLCSLVCYIQARITPTRTQKILWACGSLLGGLLAIGSKENAVVLPAFILLYEWYFFQDMRLLGLNKYFYVCITLLALFLLAATFYYLGPDPLARITNYSFRDFTMEERVLTQLRVVIFYISLICLPSPARLTLEHDFILSRSLFDPLSTLFSLLAIILLLFYAITAARHQRILSFCIFWFFGNLLIESSVIPLEIIFEHRTYLPSMLLILSLVLFIHGLLKSQRLKILLVVLAVILLSSSTYARNSIWRNEITLWTDIAQKAPNKSRAQMNLGIILSQAGRMDEALAYLNKAVMLDPDYDLALYSLGDAQMKQRKYLQASESYARGLQIDPDNPLTRFNLAKALAAAGEHENALFHYQNVAGMDSFIDHKVYYHMGNSFYRLRRYTKAMDAYNKALLLQPDYGEALQALNNTIRIYEILKAQETPVQ